ncbi:lipocalin-like domain-containing protein [Pseudohalioglobus sediminis]|uniref:Lipocalin-like domain-containing protein n=2 Tax=Pseudohalioglobus sediminis TaxID=2606449 RepID=A0A5B0WRM5_9GAMM|nr:lipocalin-like domain-containing protein [Pseudohalioglobus sediminis]
MFSFANCVRLQGMSEQQHEAAEHLVGVWSLVRSEFRTAQQQVMYPLGEDAVGQAIFTRSGHMSGQLMRRERANFASGNQLTGTPEEVQGAFHGYVAYFGRYEVDAGQGTVSTHVEGSLFPNWTGGVQLRYYQVTAEQLVLTTPPIPLGNDEITGVLTWQRVTPVA